MFSLKHYKIGLSLVGVVAVALVMLPNVVSLFYTPPNDVLSRNEAGHWLLDLLENVGRFGIMLALCLVVHKMPPRRGRAVPIVALGCLLAYYALWFAYFSGVASGAVLVGMAVFPSAFFLLVAWRQRNMYAFAFATLFATVHIAITGGNFLW